MAEKAVKMRKAGPAGWSAVATAPRLLTTGLLDGDGEQARSVFLRPGDWLFGQGGLRATTLLGSCVAVMLWAREQQLGAMCHCLLPRRRASASVPQGHFGDDAERWIEAQFARHRVPLDSLQATLAGGAMMHDGMGAGIGASNIRWAQDWVARRGMQLVQQDVGGRVVRRTVFNLVDGSVTVAHGGLLANAAPELRESPA